MTRLLPILILAAAGCLGEPAKPAVPSTAPSVPGPAAVRVEVFHDTICPWCRIGVANLEAAVKQAGVPVEVYYRPFLLDPSTPPEGRDLRAHLSSKYGVAADTMFDRVTSFGARYGVSFAWDKVRVGPKTDASHALLDWAPAAKKSAVLDAIHRAYFLEGGNLGDVSVLQSVAREAGLDAAAAGAAVIDPVRLARVRDEAMSASRSGVSGVPHYVIGGRVLNGAQSPEALLAAIRAAR